MIFENWLYSQGLGDLNESTDPSLTLIKVFCFTDKVEMLRLTLSETEP